MRKPRFTVETENEQPEVTRTQGGNVQLVVEDETSFAVALTGGASIVQKRFTYQTEPQAPR